jgi:hypothetical protein
VFTALIFKDDFADTNLLEFAAGVKVQIHIDASIRDCLGYKKKPPTS